jgi:hypothetical protein
MAVGRANESPAGTGASRTSEIRDWRQPADFNARAMARWLASRGRPRTKRRQLGPRPTLGDLQRATPWVWMWCERCQHHAPLACAVAVIRWGPNTSSDKLRRCARCTACGNKGGTIQHPGWGGNDVGFLPFPVETVTP